MGQVVLTGASDDLIEVDGDIREEFTFHNDDEGGGGDLVAFSDGTLLRIVYDADGAWRITPVVRGTADVQIKQCAGGDADVYTDEATLIGDIQWAVHGIGFAQPKN